jgi:predicted aspartyl protease/Flp pilus assembly protein TadD
MTSYLRTCCAAAAVALAATAPAGAAECTLARYASIDLVGQEAGVPVISGTLSGKPAGFIIDTGGAWSLLPSALAAGLRTVVLPDGLRFLDAAENSITSAVTVPELAFGPFKLPDVQFLKAETATIGANILQAFDVELDPVERKVNLFKHKPCDAPPAYWPHSDLAVVPFETERFNLISIRVKLDGESFRALVDTGAANSELDERAARNSFDIVLGAPGTEASHDSRAGTGKTVEEYRHQFNTLEIGDITITHPWLRLGVHGHSFFNGGSGPPLVLGMSTFAPFHLYIAYKEHKLYLTTMQGDLAAGRKPAAGAAAADTLNKVNERELVESAENAFKAGNMNAARTELDRAIEMAPDDPYAIGARAWFRRNQHDEAGAKADFDRLASMALNSPAEYHSRSTAYLKAKLFDRALDDADIMAKRWPALPDGLNMRCWVEAIMGRLAPALVDCNAALALAPNAAHILDSRGFVQLKSGRFDAAIADYSAALAQRPNYASALYGRSLAKRQNGDVAGADADLAAARAITPTIETSFGS